MLLFEAVALPVTCWLIFFLLYVGRTRRPFRKKGIPAKDAAIVATLLTVPVLFFGWVVSYFL
jgi:hypothetical protein